MAVAPMEAAVDEPSCGARMHVSGNDVSWESHFTSVGPFPVFDENRACLSFDEIAFKF